MLKPENEPNPLHAIAERVCWWQPAGKTLEDTPLFLCRVMTLGTWEDAVFCLDRFGEEAFRIALCSGPPSASQDDFAMNPASGINTWACN